MYNLVKKLPVLALVLLVASCGAGVQVDSVDKSYETETVMVDAKIPKLSGLSSESLENAINEEYEKTITTLLADFKKQASKTGDQSTFMVTTTEHYNNGGIFSAVTQIDSVASESHKNSFRITKNIDTDKCAELSLADLFSGDGYIDMINSRLESAVTENSERYQGLWEKPRLSENQDFYITPEHLVVYYLPYKLSYYERGFVEIPLSLSDMSGYLKEEYRHLANNKM
ncbi:MAG: DUF4163 domain-containing protein [Clostridia bacterium]|nr:DUF4163 domain-containing protein [Clostridia bacterium]